jgi:hypothetical protein
MKKTKYYRNNEFNFKIDLELDLQGRFVIPLYAKIPPKSFVKNLVMFSEEEDFDEDMRILIPESLGDDLYISCCNQLDKAILSHVNKFGQILPADLSQLCALSLLVMSSISEAVGRPFSLDEKRKMFKILMVDTSKALKIPIELPLY